MEKIDWSKFIETDITSPMQQIISDLSKIISDSKEKLLNDALSQRVKEGKIQGEFNLDTESKKAFPRIKGFMDRLGNEHYLFNDGSDKGLHLVSFYQEEPKFDINNSSGNMFCGFKYSLCQSEIAIILIP